MSKVRAGYLKSLPIRIQCRFNIWTRSLSTLPAIAKEENAEPTQIIFDMPGPDRDRPTPGQTQPPEPTYADLLLGQVEEAMDKRGVGDLSALYRAADTWTVSEVAGNGGNGR